MPESHWNLGGQSFWELRLQDLKLVQASFALLCAVPMKLGPRPAVLLRDALCFFGLWQLLARLVWQLCDAQQYLERPRARLPAQQLLDLHAAELLLLLRHLSAQLWAARHCLMRYCCHRLCEQEVSICAKPQAMFPVSLAGVVLQEACLRCWQNVCLERRPVLLRLVQPCCGGLAVCHCSASPLLGCPCCWWQAQGWCRAELAADAA